LSSFGAVRHHTAARLAGGRRFALVAFARAAPPRREPHDGGKSGGERSPESSCVGGERFQFGEVLVMALDLLALAPVSNVN
jgi:hypothetical protein